jgi:hypothetical protein
MFEPSPKRRNIRSMRFRSRLRRLTLFLLPLSAAIFLLAAALPRDPGSGSAQVFDPAKMPGPLSAAHAVIPGTKGCGSCHIEKYGLSPEKCLACHAEIAVRIKAGHGFHKDKKEGCPTCHAEHQGADASIIPLDPKDFDHAETGYVLEGAHAKVADCGRCHHGQAAFLRKTGKSYLLLDFRCSVCHTSPHPGRQVECLACHSKDTWRVEWTPGMTH